MNTDNTLTKEDSCPLDSTLVELNVNRQFMAIALSTVDKHYLIELCEKYNIPTHGKDRQRLALNLSKRISLHKTMKLIVCFE